MLEKRPPIGDNIVSLAPEDNPQNRLMLMGGMTGLMMVMKRDRVSPNIKTFDQLLRVIPNNLEAETELLELMKGANVKPDVSFCNQVKYVVYVNMNLIFHIARMSSYQTKSGCLDCVAALPLNFVVNPKLF